MKAKEGDDIPQHLVKLKRQWDRIGYFGDDVNKRKFDNEFFKLKIATSLPRSWDTFTGPYVKGHVDNSPLFSDPMKKADSKQFIGDIIQEYELCLSDTRKQDSKENKKGLSLADRMSDPDQVTRAQREKRQCRHCSKPGHNAQQCRHLGKNKCCKCERWGHDPDKCNQSPKTKCKPNASNSSNGNKHSRTEAQNTNVDVDDNENEESANVSISLHAEDNNVDNVCTPRKKKYKIHHLYDWLANSRTTSHITYRQEAFVTYEPIKHIPISGVGESITYAIARGPVFLYSECDDIIYTLQLHDVLHVPGNKRSLLSLGCWEKNPNRTFSGKDGKLTLHEEGGTPVARGIRLSNNVYQMSFVLAEPPADTDFAFHTSIQSPLASWEDWHKHYAHVSYSGLKILLDKNLMKTFRVNTDTPKPDCIACTEAKMTTTPYGPSTKRFTLLGKLTHIDLWGKYNKASIHGNLYYLLLVDNASQYTTVEFLKTKSQVSQHIKNYMTYLLAHGRSPCAIRMDRGSEFVNKDLKSWCQSKGIKHQMTTPFSPSQNGVAERMNQTLGKLSRAMLISSELPEFLWEAAVAHAAYVRNMSYTKFIPDATPYELWHGEKPDVSHVAEQRFQPKTKPVYCQRRHVWGN